MNKDTITIIIAVISTPFLGVLISSLFGRKKTDAETHNINIGGEISIGKEWENYGLQQKQDRKELREEFIASINSLKAEHELRFNALQTSYNKIATDYLTLQSDFDALKREFEQVKTEKERLALENKTLVERVKSLETQVSLLQDEVDKYKGVGNHIAEIMHSKVNEIQNELSQ